MRVEVFRRSVVLEFLSEAKEKKEQNAMSFWLDSTSAFYMFVNQVTGFYALFCGISI
jgi:hypothetical protein